MEPLHLKSSLGDSYTFKYETKLLSIDAYLTGSITGGSGTEKKSEVAGESLANLLRHYSVETPKALFELARDFSQDQRDEFFAVIRDLEKVTFIWSETDWSDDK